MTKPKFSSVEIDALPTILDVVEQISVIENKLALPNVSQIPSPEFLDEGRYSFVSDRNNRSIARLMPMSQSPFRYYRGQSRYHSPCQPTLYRKKKDGTYPTKEEIAAHRIKICEFTQLLQKHPVYCQVAMNVMANPVALAQHYGLATEFLDITNSKWVAAFFACTQYDWNADSYLPVGRDYEEGFGVMYISKDFDMANLPDAFFDRNGVIGYQYFARPTKQSSFGYVLDLGEDFNDTPYFDKVYFRHDLEASTMVYNMSYRQNRFIPKDKLSFLAREIDKSGEVTRDALNLCRKIYYQDESSQFLDDVCKQMNWTIKEDNTPIAEFGEETIAADWKEWMEFGKADIEARTLPIIPITTVRISG